LKKITVGLVDYGVGNHSSVRHSLAELGLRCRTSGDPAVLDACDILLLPGVGAFRPAIQALRARSLDGFLRKQAQLDKPLLGICLGMQLLAGESHEDGLEAGLNLLPGKVVPMPPPHWHIGWNTIEQLRADPLFNDSNGEAFYFNHSYMYEGPTLYQLCRTTAGQPFASVIRRDRIVGVQFHPEKSQSAGRALLGRLVRGLCDA
jgi:glutamine amidotransferase